MEFFSPASDKEEQPSLKKDSVDITKLIRSIQRAEGNPDCFGKANGHCDNMDCAWRKYCLEEYSDTEIEDDEEES